MNTLKSLFFLFACCSLVCFYSCTKDQDLSFTSESKTELQNLSSDIEMSEVTKEKWEAYLLENPEAGTQSISTRSPITYLGDACGAAGSVLGDPFTPCDWNYYTFEGCDGDTVTITVNRTDPGLDPIAFLYYGTAADCDDVVAGADGGGLTFVTSSDDAVCNSVCNCFSDPYIVLNLPFAGTYTLAVGNYLSCGGDTYEIVCTNNPYTGEGTVVIDGCDSEVPDLEVEPCVFMSELIEECADNATNHGDFVSCVAALTNAWKSADLISGKQKGKIQSCAAQSGIPYPEPDCCIYNLPDFDGGGGYYYDYSGPGLDAAEVWSSNGCDYAYVAYNLDIPGEWVCRYINNCTSEDVVTQISAEQAEACLAVLEDLFGTPRANQEIPNRFEGLLAKKN